MDSAVGCTVVIDVAITGLGTPPHTPKRTLDTRPMPPCALALDEVMFELSY